VDYITFFLVRFHRCTFDILQNNVNKTRQNCKGYITLIHGHNVHRQINQSEPIMVQITKAQLEQATKIIVVTYHSGLTKWYPFSLDNMESIIWDFENITDIQIIEKGE
tara:strand:+ start:534 stop:857 length:324 start_codon:yes stop_codon:yes gene_type:complete